MMIKNQESGSTFSHWNILLKSELQLPFANGHFTQCPVAIFAGHFHSSFIPALLLFVNVTAKQTSCLNLSLLYPKPGLQIAVLGLRTQNWVGFEATDEAWLALKQQIQSLHLDMYNLSWILVKTKYSNAEQFSMV